MWALRSHIRSFHSDSEAIIECTDLRGEVGPGRISQLAALGRAEDLPLGELSQHGQPSGEEFLLRHLRILLAYRGNIGGIVGRIGCQDRKIRVAEQLALWITRSG